MKREIKFRAWDIPAKRYISDVFTIDMIGVYVVDSRKQIYKVGERVSLQQFTGKLDDNRKEIYEGDIVVDIIGKHYSVEWNDDTCKYQLSDGSDLNDNDRYGTYLVVIGNIYENPNLLK